MHCGRDSKNLGALIGSIQRQQVYDRPRNSLEANLHLLEAANCTKFLTDLDIPSAFEGVFEHREMERATMPSLESCLNLDVVPDYPYTKSFDEAQHDPFVALHTSGSTGLPKLVVPTHGTYAASDTYQVMPSLGHAPTIVEVLRQKRVFVGMPSFHAAGLSTMNAMQALLLDNAVCRKIYIQENGKPYDAFLVVAIIARRPRR
ncbi:MAG: hypothetical protein Q9212_006797 [Teloschistes hypoglaucus]